MVWQPFAGRPSISPRSPVSGLFWQIVKVWPPARRTSYPVAPDGTDAQALDTDPPSEVASTTRATQMSLDACAGGVGPANIDRARTDQARPTAASSRTSRVLVSAPGAG